MVGGRGDPVEHHAPVGPRAERAGRGGVPLAGVGRVGDAAVRVVGGVHQVVEPVALEHPGGLPEVRQPLRGDHRPVQLDHVRLELRGPDPPVAAPVEVRLAVVVGEDGGVDVQAGRVRGAVADQWTALGVGERAERAVADRHTDVHPAGAAPVDRGVPVVPAVAGLHLAGPRVRAGPREGGHGGPGAVVGPGRRVGGGEHPPLAHDEVVGAGRGLVAAGVDVHRVADDQRGRVGGVDVGDDRVGGVHGRGGHGHGERDGRDGGGGRADPRDGASGLGGRDMRVTSREGCGGRNRKGCGTGIRAVRYGTGPPGGCPAGRWFRGRTGSSGVATSRGTSTRRTR